MSMDNGSEISTFEGALRAAYRERPCEVLPNALWKTLHLVREKDLYTAYSVDLVRGVVDSLRVWGYDRLQVYWERDGGPPEPDEARIDHLHLVLLHERHVRDFPVDRFPAVTRSFRLSHRGEAGPVRLPAGFAFREVDAAREADEVAALIRQCYEGSTLAADAVRGWLDQSVFAPDLWVWVVDREIGARAGLGIAELDPSVPEASLEWIQVHPAYRRRGVGQAVVQELLRRVAGRVEFTTAAGRVDNVTHPEDLYRRCGFVGQDVWWVMRRGVDGHRSF